MCMHTTSTKGGGVQLGKGLWFNICYFFVHHLLFVLMTTLLFSHFCPLWVLPYITDVKYVLTTSSCVHFCSSFNMHVPSLDEDKTGMTMICFSFSHAHVSPFHEILFSKNSIRASFFFPFLSICPLLVRVVLSLRCLFNFHICKSTRSIMLSTRFSLIQSCRTHIHVQFLLYADKYPRCICIML